MVRREGRHAVRFESAERFRPSLRAAYPNGDGGRPRAAAPLRKRAA